jgi:ubiquinone/menaquinone biosynthesis C-methylase UbiE
VGNILNLPFPDNTFDIVHAHQVLVHLPGSGPIDGLREMRRVCKPGGFVAARETEWDSAVIYPQIPGVLKTLKLLDELTRHNGTLWHGSRGRQWARLAGFSAHDIEASAAVVHYANSNATQWWGENMIKRLKSSALGDKLVETGIASQTELEEMCEDWNTWKDDEDAFHSRTDGHIVCRK